MQMIFNRKKGKKGSTNNISEESSSLSKRSTKQNAEPQRPVFNVPLNVALENNPSLDGIPVVALVRNCIDYVTDHGLTTEGIYRISASKNVLDEQERLINYGEIVDFNDPHEAANLLKRFLRGLPEHILTNNYAREIEQIAGHCTCSSTSPCRCEVANSLAEFMSKKLPAPNHYLLGYVFRHAQQIVLNSDMNKMNLSALGVLLQAILKLSKNQVRIFLLNASSALLKEGDEPITEFFTDIEFERYNQPSAADRNGYLEDNNAVHNEISRQERLLSDITEQLKLVSDKKSSEFKDKELQIQRIQQTISDLKRRIDTKTNHYGNSPYFNNTVVHEETKQSIQVSSLPPVFVEKQLLAVHISLKDDISEEKKKVAQHLTRLRNIQNELPPELLDSFEKIPTQQPSPQPSNNMTEVSLEEDAEKLDSKKEELLNEIMYYKDLNARLRARFEQCNALLTTLKQAKNKNELTSECLSVIAPTASSSTNQVEPEVKNSQNAGSLLVTRF